MIGEISQFHEILLHILESAVIYVLRFFLGHPVDLDGTTLHVVVRVIALLFMCYGSSLVIVYNRVFPETAKHINLLYYNNSRTGVLGLSLIHI